MWLCRLDGPAPVVRPVQTARGWLGVCVCVLVCVCGCVPWPLPAGWPAGARRGMVVLGCLGPIGGLAGLGVPRVGVALPRLLVGQRTVRGV